MTFFNIIAALCICAGAFINIKVSRRNHRKWLELSEQAHLLDIATEQLVEDLHRHMTRDVRSPKQPELFITASSQTDDNNEITLKLSLDDIDINRVQDRATRDFLLKRRLMNTICAN